MDRARAEAVMLEALGARDPARPVLVCAHFDADGLSAAAILVRALRGAGAAADARIVRRGETPWEAALFEELRAADPGLLVVADLGVRPEPLPAANTLLVDHHVPFGVPPGARLIGGNGLRPEPTTALLAWWAVGALGDQADLLWLAAMGLIGDMAAADWPELREAEARWGKTALKDAVALVNAPRRTALGDPMPAFRLLLAGAGPKDITKGAGADAEALRAAKAEVAAEMAVARKVAPRVRGEVALIRLSSAAQIHPLIAQSWRGRLRDRIVIAANDAYRPGYVHFAARTARDVDLTRWFRERAPAGVRAGEASAHYGSGHAAASGGALPIAQWREFLTNIGFEDTA